MDLDRAGPDLLCPDPGEIDRCGAIHARGLGGVGVELVARDDLDPMDLPIDRFVLLTHVEHPLRLVPNLNRFYDATLERPLTSIVSRYI